MIGELIGRGNTAEVFERGNNTVVKLFHTGYPQDSVRKEFDNSQLLKDRDLPIAKSHGLITYDDRHGIIYDRVDGESILDILMREEDIEKYATILASLHKRILSHNIQGAESLKNILKRNIEGTDILNLQCKEKLLAVLAALPEGDSLCHGDFHFGNVMVSHGKYYIIDFMNICHGHQYGDIARTVYLTEMTPVPPELGDKERSLSMKRQAADIYLKEIGVKRESLEDWLMVTGAGRLSELNRDQKEEINTVLNYLTACGLQV